MNINKTENGHEKEENSEDTFETARYCVVFFYMTFLELRAV